MEFVGGSFRFRTRLSTSPKVEAENNQTAEQVPMVPVRRILRGSERLEKTDIVIFDSRDPKKERVDTAGRIGTRRCAILLIMKAILPSSLAQPSLLSA